MFPDDIVSHEEFEFMTPQQLNDEDLDFIFSKQAEEELNKDKSFWGPFEEMTKTFEKMCAANQQSIAKLDECIADVQQATEEVA